MIAATKPGAVDVGTLLRLDGVRTGFGAQTIIHGVSLDVLEGQVTFFALEIYERVREQFGVCDKGPGVFRRNIITERMDLNALIGVAFEVQGVRFLGTQESAPCHWMNTAFADGAEAALEGNGGLRAKILTDGVLRAGDRCDLLE